MRRFLLVAVVLIAAGGSAACDDGIGPGEPLIARDSSVVLAAPSASTSLPSALDFTQIVTRYPEQVQDAGQWDFALRQQGSTFRFIPNPFQTGTRGPLILRSPRAFDDLERAPTARSAYGDTAVALEEGAVYVVRSRYYQSGVGFCFSYAKLQVRDLNAAAGTADFRVAANVGCADDRLEDD